MLGLWAGTRAEISTSTCWDKVERFHNAVCVGEVKTKLCLGSSSSSSSGSDTSERRKKRKKKKEKKKQRSKSQSRLVTSNNNARHAPRGRGGGGGHIWAYKFSNRPFNDKTANTPSSHLANLFKFIQDLVLNLLGKNRATCRCLSF